VLQLHQIAAGQTGDVPGLDRVRNAPSPLTGSPVLFEKGLFQELLTLPQGMGGSVLLRKYPAHVHTVYIADRNELADADTPEALAQLEALARQKL